MVDAALKPVIEPCGDPTLQCVRFAQDQRQAARVRVSVAMVRSAGVEVA